MEQFQKQNKGSMVEGIDMKVEVLTNGHWPEQNVINCTLPPELKTAAGKFGDFYRHKYSNRHLSWLFH